MTTTKTLPLALGLLFTLALPLQAQTFTAAAGPQLNQVIENIGGSPQLVYWNGSGGSISRYAWATVDRGTMTCFARSEHYDPATFQSDAMGYASWKATDVVFESAGSGIATVGVNLTLEGDHWLLLGNGVSLSMSMNGQGLGSATATASGVSGSGYLSGYGMSGQVSFTHYVTVPLNTAVNLQMRANYRTDLDPTGDCQSLTMGGSGIRRWSSGVRSSGGHPVAGG